MVEPPVKVIELVLEDSDISSVRILYTLPSLVESIHDFSWQFYASDTKINTLRIDIVGRDKLGVWD